MGIEYFNPQYDGDIVYSIDMIQLDFYISKYFVNFLNYFYTCLQKFGTVRYYTSYNSYSYGRYKYLFEIQLLCSGTCVVGFDLLSHNSTSYKCMLRYNPNKCRYDYMSKIISIISDYVQPVDGFFFQLKRFDLAIDIPIQRENVVLVKNGRSVYHKVVSDSLTEYLGGRNSDGFVKVYDKQVEYNKELKATLKDEDDKVQESLYYNELKIDKPLTRVEITCVDIDNISYPEIYILGSYNEDLSSLNDTQVVLVELLRRLDPDERASYLNRLGRDVKKKLKPYVLQGIDRFNYNFRCISDLYMMNIMYVMTAERGNLWLDLTEQERSKIDEDIKSNTEDYQQLDFFS